MMTMMTSMMALLLVRSTMATIMPGIRVQSTLGTKNFSKNKAEYPTTTMILDHVLGQKTNTWERLAEMVDTFGPRMTGTEGLENSLDWIEARLREDGHTVLRESVQVPNWKRGAESLVMISPRVANIPMLGLGLSIGTGGRPVEAFVVVVSNWDELSIADCAGKIVVMNWVYDNYGTGSSYRRQLATRAAERGAVAALMRSVTPFSLSTPHTGSSDTASIPSAAITIEVSEMFKRMQDRGQAIQLSLTMGATGCTVAGGCETIESSNIIAQILGSELPNEIVAIGGHIDSWDIGQGASDDGGGAFAAWAALNILRDLNIRPRRTIRAVFWNAEENSGAGADDYYDRHKDENHLIVLESDGGVWAPFGFTISQDSIDAADFAGLVILGEQLSRIGAGNITYGYGGADTQVWCAARTPCGSQVVLDPFTNLQQGSGYFWYHHTDADTMTAFTAEEIDLNAASFAVFALGVSEYGFTPPAIEVASPI
eukprot:m.15736 g.15736  ORF g.15736 m.15736 type:complete len:484 (+) comp10726_c0_seq1:72-1523(+)